MEKNELNIHCDGGSRGNPGPAAVGVVIKNQDNQVLFEISKTIGESTNNVAEYRGVIEALKLLKNKQVKTQRINFFLDSQVVANQLAGIFKIKELHLKKLYLVAQNLIQELKIPVTYIIIKREFNQRADFLVNQALDQATF
ncbi:MAG: Ribonuclease H [Candidatus Curtissbacteria bacterium GW2011_GWA1_40_16]|uniref:Ribonuclease H n=1 Tax=Candidatus Curtissbacteria bacterium GW2011_GWA1_40_16 TaxID=1618405 RepID=A0A0G0UGZ7_9BACT|nr:MAG: Ribonuclease H [Candidatus Curtissbacteria bacterium GW2011_GWA1_40_16]